MRVVAEGVIRQLNDACAFEVDLVEGVDHDLGDRHITKQRLERSETEHFVGELRRQMEPFPTNTWIGLKEPILGCPLDRPSYLSAVRASDQVGVEISHQLVQN